MHSLKESFRGQPDQQVDPMVPRDGAETVGVHWSQKHAREAAFGSALEAVPPAIRNIATLTASTWRMDGSVVLIYLLHALAGALGRTYRSRLGPVGQSCPFNLITCTASGSYDKAYETLAEPWLKSCRNNVRMHEAYGKDHFINELAAYGDRSSGLQGAVENRTTLHAEMRTVRRHLYPCETVRSSSPKEMLLALRQSFDSCIMGLGNGLNPLQQLLAQGPKQGAQLAALLEMSWQDQGLPIAGPVPRRGVLHLCWQSTYEHARRIMLSREGAWYHAAPPVLLIRQASPPGYLHSLDKEVFSKWEMYLGTAYGQRCTMETVVWELSEDTENQLGKFADDLGGQRGCLTPFNYTRFRFMPELVLRMSMLLSMLDLLEAKERPAKSSVNEDTMKRACALGWWMAVEHLECLRWLSLPPGVNEDATAMGLTAIDNIDDEQLKVGILARLSEKGPLSPRELTRTFHELPAKRRDSLLLGLLRDGLVAQTTEGLLKAQ